jgi:hypothetical protein
MERVPNAKRGTLHYWRAPYHLSPNTLPRASREKSLMNNLKELNPFPINVQESSEDPPGFIYPSYRAAPTETQRDEASLKASHQGVAYVSSSVGGSVSTLSFEDTKTSNRLSPSNRLGGSTRDRVRGFSRESRRNLLLRLASINRSAFRAFKGRLISITLTYPHEYPEDPEVCKNHLKALRRRLQREFGEFAGFWRMGIQRRGAFHFHLLLFVGPSVGSMGDLRRFISTSWYEVTGRVSEGHLCAGTRVEAVRKWKEATSYLERYMAKPEEFPEGYRPAGSGGYGMRTYSPSSGRLSKSASGTPSRSAGSTGSWRRGRVAALYAVLRCS